MPTPAEGAYHIVNQQSGTVLDLHPCSDAVAGFEEKDIWDPLRNQLWLLELLEDHMSYVIRNVQSGTVLCLDKAQDGTQAICRPYDGSPGQQWKFQSLGEKNGAQHYYIINSLSYSEDLVLDLDDGQPRGAVMGYFNHGGSNERWALLPVSSPTAYWIRNKVTGNVLDATLHYSSTKQIRDLPRLAVNRVSREQMWVRQPAEDGEGEIIKNLQTGDVIDQYGGDARDGTHVSVWPYNGGKHQHWHLEALKGAIGGEQLYQITCVKNGKAISVAEDSINDRGVVTCAVTGLGKQKWELLEIPIPPFAWVTIRNARYGHYLGQGPAGAITLIMSELLYSDKAIQWRFVPRGSTPFYFLVNRATGRMLEYRDGTALHTIEWGKNDGSLNCAWALKREGEFVGIVHAGSGSALDDYFGSSIQVHDGPTSLAKQWCIEQASKSFPLAKSTVRYSR